MPSFDIDLPGFDQSIMTMSFDYDSISNWRIGSGLFHQSNCKAYSMLIMKTIEVYDFEI